MFEPVLLLIAAAFLIAGFVKGALGLGLPTVAMGLLAVTMPPAQALAIVIVPAIVTNIWQTFVGPYLRDIIRRLWPLMAGRKNLSVPTEELVDDTIRMFLHHYRRGRGKGG